MKLKNINRSLFSKNLAKYREKNNYKTPKQFYEYLKKEYEENGKKIPFSESAYYAYENGNRTPKLEIVIQLAQFLHTPLDFLTGLYDDTNYIESLVNRNYQIQRLEDMLIITNKAGQKASISVTSLENCFENFYNEIPNHIAQFLDQKIQEVNTIDKTKKLERLADLAIRSIAATLYIDYDLFAERIKNNSSIDIFKNEPLQALFFYYFTHCRPDLETENTEKLLMFYSNCIKSIQLDQEVEEKDFLETSASPDIQIYISYQPEIRNPEVENCFISYTITDNNKFEEYRKKDFSELKLGFFLALFNKSPIKKQSSV